MPRPWFGALATWDPGTLAPWHPGTITWISYSSHGIFRCPKLKLTILFKTNVYIFLLLYYIKLKCHYHWHEQSPWDLTRKSSITRFNGSSHTKPEVLLRHLSISKLAYLFKTNVNIVFYYAGMNIKHKYSTEIENVSKVSTGI